jgi:hypothetical protein
MFSNHYRHLLLFAVLISNYALAQQHTFPIITKTTKVSIVYGNKSNRLDSIAANLLAEDIERATSFKPKVTTALASVKGNVIVIGSIQSALIRKFISAQSSIDKNLQGKWLMVHLLFLRK